MAFPKSLEASFLAIRRTPAETWVRAQISLVQDGGIVDGQQRYIYTPLEVIEARFTAGEVKDALIARMREILAERNIRYNQNLDPARFICNLP